MYNTTTIMQSGGFVMQSGEFVCSICLTHRHTEYEFNKHFACCSGKMHSTETQPSIHEIFKIVLKLDSENKFLKQEISKLKRNGSGHRRKMINDWLVTDVNLPSKTYTEWMKTVVVKREYLMAAMNNGLKDGIKMCLENVLIINEKLPIRAFTQKANTIYIFEKTEDSNETKWRIMTAEEMKKMVLILSHRILNEYMNWESENQERIDNDEKMKQLHIKYLTNVNGGTTKIESRISDVKHLIYSKIQENVKNIDF